MSTLKCSVLVYFKRKIQNREDDVPWRETHSTSRVNVCEMCYVFDDVMWKLLPDFVHSLSRS